LIKLLNNPQSLAENVTECTPFAKGE